MICSILNPKHQLFQAHLMHRKTAMSPSSFVKSIGIKVTMLCGFALLFIFYDLAGQQKDSIPNWHRGFLILEDRLKIEGLISYHVKTRLVEIKPESEEETVVLNEKKINTMVLTDPQTGITRSFYSFRVSETDSGFKGSVLFEVLFTMDDFRIVSRLYPLKDSFSSRSGRVQLNHDQYESFYVLRNDGEIKLLATFPPGEQSVYPSRVKPFLNDALLVNIMGDDWTEVKAYAKGQKLRLKHKAGLLKVFQYYQTLQD